jgi:vacuolar-type H+-ATPase subunit I/STV1
MKTTLKKIIAFVAVTFLAVPFSAFSQDAKVKNNEDKMHIKIEIENNGKTTNVDTTINPEDLAALNEHLKDLDIHIDSPEGLPGADAFSFEWDGKKFDEQMKELGKQLKDKEFMNLDDKELPYMEDFEKQMKEMGEKIKNQCYQYKYKISDDPDSAKELIEIEKELDDLDNMNFDFNHDGKTKTIIIEGNDIKIDGDKGEKEIIIKSKDGGNKKDNKQNKETKKVIIIMKSSGAPLKQVSEFAAEPIKNENDIQADAGRVRVVGDSKKENNSWLSELACYPNPSMGEFTLSFRLNNPEPAELKIMDIAGREVYAETIPENAELVEKQIKLPAKSSAAYLLILRQGDNWHHEKLFVKS